MHLYVIGLGSNRRHRRYGRPANVVVGAMRMLGPLAASPITHTAPIGPSRRRFANAAILLETSLSPIALLKALKEIERDFGRRRGKRWGERVLDLDILLWSGGRWSSASLTVPHPHLVRRRFALDPVLRIAPNWRIPGHGTVRQCAARLTRPRPVHRSSRRSGP